MMNRMQRFAPVAGAVAMVTTFTAAHALNPSVADPERRPSAATSWNPAFGYQFSVIASGL